MQVATTQQPVDIGRASADLDAIVRRVLDAARAQDLGAGRLFLREKDLVGELPVSEEKAAVNRAWNLELEHSGAATGAKPKKARRWPVRARPGRQGMLPFSKSSLWRKVLAGEFPAPLKIGGATVWRASDVAAWAAAQK